MRTAPRPPARGLLDRLTVMLHEGSYVQERIRLTRPLAHGGMAHLWVAEHRTLGVDVVVKVLAPTAAQDAMARQRFVREGRVTAKVSSPHIVRVLDCCDGSGASEDHPFLVMELLQGEDLSTRLSREGRLSVAETLRVVEHVASALEAAHRVGVIHRDVKPENVFLVETPGGNVAKLIDFGIAKDTSDASLAITRADATMGTPGYMSPEQVLSARDVDARCDVWALAVVAYVCLTGKMPFAGETFGAVCIAINGRQFDPPSRERPELPATIDEFFATAFRGPIDLRYPSARALHEALREAANDAPVLSAGPTVELDDLDALLLLGDEMDLEEEENVPFELGRPKSGFRAKAGGLEEDQRAAQLAG